MFSSFVSGEEVHLLSQDTLPDRLEGDDIFIPLEYLNGLTPAGLPPHDLVLKVGAIVMLLRNLHMQEGLCNGTRLRVDHIAQEVLTCTIVFGQRAGQQVLLPRMWMEATGSTTPIPFKRRHFPVRLSFVITINKSQGQTLDRIGLFLPQPVFGHGMMYTALSRVRNFESIRVVIRETHRQGKKRNRYFTVNEISHSVLQASTHRFARRLNPANVIICLCLLLFNV